MVRRKVIEALARSIGERFKPERIILFGSYAYGKPNENSDIDLLVIMSFEGGATQQALRIAEGTDPAIPIDVVVRRPEDAKRRYKQFDPMIRDAFDRGRILYE